MTVTGTAVDGDTVTLSREFNPSDGTINTFLETDDGDANTAPTAIDLEIDDSYDGEYAAAKIGIVNTRGNTQIDEIVSLNTDVSASAASRLDVSDYVNKGDDSYGIVAYFDGNNNAGKIVQNPVELGQSVEFDQKGDIDSDSGVVLKLNEFQDSGGAPVNLEGRTVTLVIEFESNGNRYREEITAGLDQSEQA
ncbi:hypothetical protein DMP03_03795 [Halosegnis rubeus]|uniref:Uncharacterized protein n=1 Tax=Halosegnis rubeus TaxID=2212850 RepID=A0A5N5UIH5_9EURY|nr:hypothetical protein DMP03_03795 [Halosegnis rubeus]